MNIRVSALLAASFAALAAGPVLARQATGHEGHHAHPARPAAPVPVPASDPHAGHGAPATMDHGTMDHAGHGQSAAPTVETPPPPEAGSGPPRAADAIWGAEAMRAARQREHLAHGDFPVLWFQADRLEWQARTGSDGLVWDVQGYYGGPTSRLWLKSEGEAEAGGGIDHAQVQALWSRAVNPYWDLQVGVRQDLAVPATTHAVIGVQGLAPYEVEVDAALFVSHRGDVTALVEVEQDQRITSRLILQPRASLALSAQDIPELGIGAGLDQAELGLRLRYQLVPEFAPYVGIEQSWRLGGSADHARATGRDTSDTRILAGLRFWF